MHHSHCPRPLRPLAAPRYRKWSLGGTELVVRCEVDGAIRLGDSVQMLAVHALNEFGPKWSGEWALQGSNKSCKRVAWVVLVLAAHAA